MMEIKSRDISVGGVTIQAETTIGQDTSDPDEQTAPFLNLPPPPSTRDTTQILMNPNRSFCVVL